MDLFKSVKRVARNIAAKNQRRRDRVKGTSRKNGIFEGKMNTAQTMVVAWLAPPSGRRGPSVSTANVRASKRLVARKAQWDKTPVLRVANSRQVMRAAHRLSAKAARQVNVSGLSLDWCIGKSKVKTA